MREQRIIVGVRAKVSGGYDLSIKLIIKILFDKYSMTRGPKKHLKRVNTPRSWLLSKMGGIYATRPSQGPHKLRECLPLSIILRYIVLHVGATSRSHSTVARPTSSSRTKNPESRLIIRLEGTSSSPSALWT